MKNLATIIFWLTILGIGIVIGIKADEYFKNPPPSGLTVSSSQWDGAGNESAAKKLEFHYRPSASRLKAKKIIEGTYHVPATFIMLALPFVIMLLVTKWREGKKEASREAFLIFIFGLTLIISNLLLGSILLSPKAMGWGGLLYLILIGEILLLRKSKSTSLIIIVYTYLIMVSWALHDIFM
ncbi:MAG: hypothetical protein UR27_C0014G0016 [Candidatus Peregrinibacteria bacterium GW2011_GWA2_33_10]|nr:MAG: hypothetical protein UR27_C0014G0016 [Candidatus Peregrinibacteria bacterium GW2011_GWA2_33_10]